MAFIIKDRVKEGTTSTGTGDVSLGGAAATFDTFQSYMSNGDTTYYAIVHTTSGTDEWEVGLGTWNTGNTLTRTTVLAGSNGSSAVNFSAGTKDVFMTYPASKAAVAGEDVTFADITVTGTVDGRDVAADGTKLDGIDTSADVTDATTVAAAGALMKSGGTMTGNLILNADPTTALGAATKEYVDTIASAGIHYHDPVRVESPSALTVTYNNGSSGVGATLTNAGTQAAITIDGVALSLNDRVLIYKQTDQTQNGVYTVTTVGSASTNWVLTRSTDTDSYGASDPDSFGKGDAFFVKEGNTGAGELYVMTTAGTITFGTTNIVFSQVAETAVYNAGTGITLTGTTFSIGQDVATSSNVTFNQVTAAIIGNVTGNLTGDVTGNADTATALETARTIQLSGDVTGSASFDGTANINITAAVQDDSHAHVISNVDGLQAALDGKTDDTTTISAGNGLTGGGDLSANRTLNVGAGGGITVSADAVAHADTSTQASVNNSGNTFIQDVTLDTYGHVTGLTSSTVTVGDGDITVASGGGLTGSGTFSTNQSSNETITLSHADTSSQASVNGSGRTYIQDITLDGYGHVTAIGTATETVVNTNQLTTFQVEDGDGTEVTISHGKEWKFVEAGGIDINWTDTTPGSDADPYDLSFSINTGITAGNGLTGGGTLNANRTLNVGAGTGVTVNADTVAIGQDVSTSSNVTFNDIRADGGNLILGDDAYSQNASYVGIKTANQSGSEDYMIISGTSDGSTYVSAKAGSTTHIRGGGNNSTYEIKVFPGAYATAAGSTIITEAGSGLSKSSRTLSHADTSTLSGTYGSTSDGTKIDQITVDGFGHITSITTGATGDIQGVTAGSGLTGGGTSGTVTISHADTSSQASVNNSGRTYIQDITLDTYGHITGITSATETVTDTNTTYSAGTNLSLSGTTFNVSSNPSFTDVYVADQIIHTGDTNTYMQFHAEDQWRVVTGGAERLEVNNSQITSTEPIHAPSFHGDGSNLTGVEGVPSGVICMWSGTDANIPSGWYLCNGANGTPDLRDRFIVGSGSSYSTGNTGGSASVTLTEAQMPSHTHSGSSLSTNTTGEHSHTFRHASHGGSGWGYYVGGANISPWVTITTSTSGNHSHDITGSTASAGSGSSHENRPPYYALAYIMKS